MNYPDVMYEWAKNRPKKHIDRISPSSLGRCMRTHYWAIKGQEGLTPPNPGAVLNFQVGFLWETIVSDALKESKVTFLEQLRLESTDMNMAGTLDFCTLDPETNEWEVSDSKTEAMNAASYRKREGRSFFKAHLEYAIQLCCYYLLLEEKGMNVKPQGKFIIIIKDNGLIQEEVCFFNDELIEKTKQRIKTLNEYLDSDTLPPCECEGWVVGYCNFGDPNSLIKSKTGKMINSKCCEPKFLKEEV
jgi:hypothetical protein